MSASDLDAWLDRQARASVAGVAACLSATGLVGARRGFGQSIRPRRGSVVASPVTALGPGEPDYFFHWIRDSALAMEVVLQLAADGEGTRDWMQEFRDFVGFSLDLAAIDGAQFVAAHDYRRGVGAEFVQFLRPEAELAAISGPAVSGDVRVNPDGTLDIIRWSRPQHDGPALRALAGLRAAAAGVGDTEGAALLRQDLDYTERHGASPSYDIWEERSGEHYYTRLVQYAALLEGARQLGEARYATAAAALAQRLDRFWSPAEGIYRCSLDPGPKRLDMANILGVLHAGLPEGRHSVRDERVQATLAALEAQAAADYPINRGRAPGAGLALGRFRGDVYGTAGPGICAASPPRSSATAARRSIRRRWRASWRGRCDPRNGTGDDSAVGRAVGAVRSGHRPAELRAGSRLEPCRVPDGAGGAARLVGKTGEPVAG